MSRDQQKARKMVRKKGGVGATGQPGTPQGHHVTTPRGKEPVACQCGGCSGKHRG